MTSADRLYQSLKQDILTCALAPGSTFSEGELCQRYRASRTPVREACHRLEQESFISVIPFRGYMVASLTFAEFRNLHEVQLTVDPATAALAAERATPQQIKGMAAGAKYEYKGSVKSTYFRFLQRNFDFHIAIAEASQNDHFVKICQSIQTRLLRYFYLIIAMEEFGRELADEHLDIFEAIRSRDAALARQRSMDHVMNSLRRCTGLLVGNPTGLLTVTDPTQPLADLPKYSSAGAGSVSLAQAPRKAASQTRTRAQ